MKFEFVFIRHGESTANLLGEIATLEEDMLVELTEKWKTQALETKKVIESDVFDSIFASDMTRTQQTATIIFKDQKIILDARLREGCVSIDPGVRFNYEKIEKEERKRLRLLGFDSWETFQAQVDRVNDFINMMYTGKYGSKIAIVTHNGCLRALEVIFNNMSLDDALVLKRTDNCGVLRYFIDKD